MVWTCALLAVTAAALVAQDGTEGESPMPAPPAAREIPGITVDDAFPNACVDCHVTLPEIDARLSAAMERWSGEVEPRVLAAAQAAAPEGVTLKGKHPAASRSLADVPAACVKCHDRSSRAPAFAPMVHLLHLSGGDESHYLTLFRGECTHCHKLDPATGAWSVPSAAEK